MIAAAATVMLVLLVVGRRRLKEMDGRMEKVRMITRLPEIADHQRVQLLQREIVKRDRTEARLEQEVSESTAANRQLQRKITELTSATEQLRQAGSGTPLEQTTCPTGTSVCPHVRSEIIGHE
jgi:predicted RNase H-like nuclease (RuvC/YqgF family)